MTYGRVGWGRQQGRQEQSFTWTAQDYKLEHKKYYDGAGLTWPVVLVDTVDDGCVTTHLDFSGLFIREREVVSIRVNPYSCAAV